MAENRWAEILTADVDQDASDDIRVTMTLRISQYAALCGLSLLTMSGFVTAQTPRYESPLNAPAAPPRMNLPTATAITPNGQVVEDVVARVNDQIISRSDVERSEQQLAQELQQTNANAADSADRQKNMLRDMIDQQLLLSRGKELGLDPSAEVIRRLDEIRKQNKLDAIEDKDCPSGTSCNSLEKAARQQGASFEDFRANIRNSIITQQVVRDEVGRRLQMSPTQEQAFYDAHKQEFVQPEQVRLSEILIPTPADATDAAVTQAQTKAESVEAKVKSGDKFDELAKTYSGGPTAAQGGDLGEFKRGALAKVLEDQTFGLKAGEATAPIRTRQGFVILKVTEHAAEGVPPLKEVEPQIQEAMYVQQMQPALRAYLSKLRTDAYLDVRPGYVDTGSTAKETKPKFIYTAYTAPAVKKKKVTQKQRFDRGGHYSTQPKGAGSPATASSAAAAVPPPAGSAPAPATPFGDTAAPLPATAAVAPTTAATTTTAPSGTQLATITKRRKVRKEKVRFGQAPRNSLPAGPETAGMAGDEGLGTDRAGEKSAQNAPASPLEQAAAPGTAVAPLDASNLNQSVSNQPASNQPGANVAEANPFAPVAPPQQKTRYSARAKSVAAEKVAKKSAKVNEKAARVATPMTTDEQAASQVQAAPLGLSGDTARKPKKIKVKGAPKERLQDQAAKPAGPPPVETPSKASDRGTVYEGTAGAPKPKPSADDTTLPSVTAPSSATPPQGTTTPATPGNPIPTPPPQ